MKKFINKILNVPKLVLTIWIMLWVTLIMLLIMKFCFGIWYPIVVRNELFMNFCNGIDNYDWLKLIIRCLFYTFSSNFLLFSLTRTKKYPKWYLLIIFNVIFIGIFFAKTFIYLLGLCLEISLVLLSIIYNLKNNKFGNKLLNVLIPIVVYVILNLWELLMLLVRGLDLNNFEKYPFLIQFVLQLDYYIFLLITYVEVCYMGTWTWGWFFGKDVSVLKAEKEKELAKANPDMEKIAEIDYHIEELEKEGK